MRKVFTSFFIALLAFGPLGCVKKMLLNGQIESTREGSKAMDTVGDYEMAQRAASAGLAQFEGMHHLAPSNKDALFLLTKGWAGYAYAFIEDEMEDALDRGNEALSQYHKGRAVTAYTRAIGYGVNLLEKKHAGFHDAAKNEASIKAWLSHFEDEEDAPNLLWTGYAWMARANLMRDELEYVANLFVGVHLVQHSVKLDPNYNFRTGEVVLAAYHARSPMAEMDQAKTMFDSLLQKSERKTLAVHFNFATKYYCVKNDRENYDRLLKELLEAEDPDPKQRLLNTIMKRRAVRWSTKKRKEDMCGMYAQ